MDSESGEGAAGRSRLPSERRSTEELRSGTLSRMTHRLKERMLQPRGLSLVHQQPSCPSKGNQVTLLRRFARRSCNLKPFGLYTSAVSIGSLLRGAGWARRYRHLDKPTRTKVQFLSAIMLQIAVRHIKGQRKAPSRRSLGQLG